jgi:uncharacterized membrane protein
MADEPKATDIPPIREDSSSIPQPRVVSAGAPFTWLAKGAADLRDCPVPALFYGACFALMGYVIHWVFDRAYEYTFAFAGGFMLVGPYVAIGLYDIARRRELGEPCRLAPTLTAWRANVGAIGVYAMILTVILLVWARASLVTVALFYSGGMPTIHGFIEQITNLENIDFIAAYMVEGGLFATLVFCTSAVSIPLMLHRRQDAVTAVIASFLAGARNPVAMLLWGLLIVALALFGFATAFVGLIVTMPLVGLATWHAYRELVS